MDASSETSPSLNPQECVSDVGKVSTGLTSVDQREIDMHGHPLPWETGLALGPVANNQLPISCPQWYGSSTEPPREHRLSPGDLMHATSESAALELAVGRHLTLSPQIPCYKIATEVYGPLPQEQEE